jgi:hypothetical protein
MKEIAQSLQYKSPDKSTKQKKNADGEKEIWRVFTKPSHHQRHRERQHLQDVSYQKPHETRWWVAKGMVVETKEKHEEKNPIKQRQAQCHGHDESLVHTRNAA